MRRLTALLAALLVGSAIAATPVAAAAETATATDGTTAPFDYEGDNLTLSAGYAQQVTGQLDRPAGTEVSVALRSEESDQPFLRKDWATVQEDGSFAVQFDLAAIEPDSDAVAILYADGERIANRSVHIESCGDACSEQSRAASDESASSAGVSGDGVRLAETHVSVRNGETAAFDVQFGDADTATLSLSTEGTDGEPTWEVVATVRDTDGDGTATVQFDTAAAGSDAPTLTADDGLTVTRESTLSDDALDPASYALAVDDGTEIDDPESIGTVAVTADRQDGDASERDETSSDEGAPAEPQDNVKNASIVGGGVLALLAVLGVGLRLRDDSNN